MIPMYLVIVKSKDVRPPSLFLKSETKRMYCSATKTDARTVRQLAAIVAYSAIGSTNSFI